MTEQDGREAVRVARRVHLLVCAHVVLGVALLAWRGGTIAPSSLPALVGFTAGYALLGAVPLHLELRRHAHTITITEAVVVIAAFSLDPIGVAAVALLGELVSSSTTRLQPLQRLFNAAQTFGAASLAAVAFQACRAGDPTSLRGWGAGFVAALVFATVSMVSVASVLAILSSDRFRRIVRLTATSTAVTGLASAALGLACLCLAAAAPAAPLLLAPVVALVVLESKRVTDASAERLRFERLYEASSRTARLSRVDEALTVLAREARGLLTGAQGICCAQGDDGTWSAVIVDDAGPRALDPAAAEALRSVSGEGTVELAWQRVPPALRAACTEEGPVVVAGAEHANGARVVLAVIAPRGGEKRNQQLAEVLSAFASTAALAVRNAHLYAEVEAALHHQLDLNRQKAEFVAAVSHELRTPLAAVLGSVQTIGRLGGRLSDDDRAGLLDAALAQGARLRRLIEDLLLVAAAEHRTVAIDPRPVDLDAVLVRLVAELATASGRDRVRVRIAPEASVVRTDEEKLQRILTNLVENASKYAPEGPIEVEVTRDGDVVVMTVADHGPGITPADRERVFEQFVQLDQSSTRRQGGTGLGLHLCRNVAELLGATLTVGGRADGTPGAAFTLALPDAAATPEGDDADASGGDATTAGGKSSGMAPNLPIRTSTRRRRVAATSAA